MMNDCKTIANSGLTRALLALAVLLPGLLAYGHICYLIATATSNCLTHDYELIVPAVDKILSPGYNWANFISDTSVGPHCLAPSIIVHASLAPLTNWNAQVELYFGTFLIFARCLLFTDCMPKEESIWTKLFFFSSLLALNFGTCCTSTLIFGNPCISAGVGLFGFALGLWAILKLEAKSALAKALVFGGGMACAGFGKLPTLVTWGLYTLASRIVAIKSKLHYAVLALGVTLSVALVLSMKVSKLEGNFGIRPRIFINVLGRSFTNNTGISTAPMRQSEIVCLVGFIFLALISFCLWKRRREINLKSLAAPVCLLLYGLIGAAAISVGRDYIGSWYSQFAVLFWTGLLGAAAVLMFSKPSSKIYTLLAALPFLFCGTLYLSTNLEHRDKDFYRRVHAPVGASVLRHEAIAPTFSESAIYATEVGDVDQVKKMSAPLLKRHWSIFAPEQTWKLQGDFLLPLVKVKENRTGPTISWINDRDEKRSQDFRSPEHLNLCLPEGSSVSWEIYVPENLKSAYFETAMALPSGEKNGGNNDKLGKITVLEVSPEQNTEKSIEGKEVKLTDSFSPVKIDLRPYQKKLLRFVFSTSGNGTGSAVFKHPLLQLSFTEAYKQTSVNPTLRPGCPAVPSNTEKSPYFPKFSTNDMLYQSTQTDIWRTFGLQPLPGAMNGLNAYEATGNGLPAIDINCGDKSAPVMNFPRLGDYSDICLEFAKPEEDSYRIICVQLILDGNRMTQAILPLLKDAQLHTYSYEMRLFGEPPNSKITGIKILPTYLQSTGKFTIGKVRLVRKAKAESNSKQVSP